MTLHPIQIGPTEFYTFIGVIATLLGYIARQQIKWMGNVDKNVHQLQIDIAVIKSVLRIKDEEDH